jgi:hypothetical protein
MGGMKSQLLNMLPLIHKYRMMTIGTVKEKQMDKWMEKNRQYG